MPFQLNKQEITWLEDKIARMSLYEKIGQTSMEHIERVVRLNHTGSCEIINSVKRYLENYPLGNIFVGAEIIKDVTDDVKEIKNIIGIFQKEASIPMLVAGDVESGVGGVVKGLTKFVPNMALGVINDEKLTYETARFTALEARHVGLNWAFGPVVDLSLIWDRNACRCISDDEDTVIKISSAVIKGLQNHKVAACAKHFPGSTDFRNAHLTSTVNEFSKKDWHNKFGYIYSRLIEQGVYTIMVGHEALKWIEKYDYNENGYCPATLSKRVITNLLRDKLGFEGVIVSDALNMSGYISWGTHRQRIIQSFNAGIDVMLWPGEDYYKIISEAVVSGEITIERLDESVKRILALKIRLGLISIYNENDNTGKEDIEDIKKDAKRLNEELSKRSVTCIRNLKNIFPLNKNKIRKAFVLRFDAPSGRACNDIFIKELKNRGIEVAEHHAIEFSGWDKLTYLRSLEKKGGHWDVFFVLYDSHQFGSERPSSTTFKAFWALAGLEETELIYISFVSPFLVKDLPKITTFLTTVGVKNEASVRQLIKAMFGEADFNKRLPVEIRTYI